MAQPIVKYTLTKRGTIPGWLSSDSRAFAGIHGITGNKSGKIPRYEEPQDIIYLGIASGDPDPDGTPDDYIGTFANKTALQTYITETGSTLQYKTTTGTATGIVTSVTTGLKSEFPDQGGDGQGISTSDDLQLADDLTTLVAPPEIMVAWPCRCWSAWRHHP